MLNSNKKFYCYLQEVTIAGKQTSVKFSSRGYFACPSTLPDPSSFPTGPYLTDGWGLGLRGPTSSTMCPTNKSGDTTNTGMEGKGARATQDLALLAER